MDNQNLNQQLPNNFEPEIPKPGQQFEPMTSDPIQHPKKSKKKILLIILLALLLAGGTAAAYFFFFKKEASAPAPSPQASTQQTETKPTGPVSLNYLLPSGTNKPESIGQLNLSNNSAKTILELTDYQAVIESTVQGSNIAFVATPKTGKTQSAVFYSNDNGTTYTKVYETKAYTGSNNIGDQITSLVLSNDGSLIIIGLLPQDTRKNVVTEITPGTNATKALFTSDQAGIFLNAYNKGKQIIYTKGCYNCGGELAKTIYSYDLAAKKETALVTTKDNFDKRNIVANKDFTTLGYVETKLTTAEVGPVPAGPYTIKQLTLSDGKSQTLATIGKANAPIVNLNLGYMADGKTPYYVADKTITSLNGTKATTLFESTKDNVYEAYYVSADTIYFSLSLAADNPDLIYRYKTADKTLTQLLKDIKPLSVIGVTSND